MSFHIPGGSASDKFAVSKSGVVFLRKSLDREKAPEYYVPILAKSNKILDLTTLQVIVVDENDNPPEFKPGSCYTLAVPENEASSVIHTIAAIDRDEGKNGELMYSIVGEFFENSTKSTNRP